MKVYLVKANPEPSGIIRKGVRGYPSLGVTRVVNPNPNYNFYHLLPQGILLTSQRAPLGSDWISRLAVSALVGAVALPPAVGVLLPTAPQTLYWAEVFLIFVYLIYSLSLYLSIYLSIDLSLSPSLSFSLCLPPAVGVLLPTAPQTLYWAEVIGIRYMYIYIVSLSLSLPSAGRGCLATYSTPDPVLG